MTKHTGEKKYKCKPYKSYKCNQCDFAASHKRSLDIHLRTHASEKPYNPHKCSQCDFTSAHKRNLDIHSRTHTGEKPFKCNQCDFATSHKHSLNSHFRTHSGEKPYKCNHCEYTSSNKLGVVKHANSQHKIPCAHCEYKAKNDEHLELHVEAVHLKNDGMSIKCNQCDFGEKPYECKHWKYASSQKSSLGIQMKKHTGEKKYKCKYCYFSFDSPKKLSIHKKSRHKIPCTQCAHKVKNGERLKMHVEAVHLNLKRYACNSCDYKSYYEKDVMSHIISQHKNLNSVKSQKLDCSECMSNTDHNQHRKSKKTLFACKVCKYETRNSNFLKRHKKLVHGPKAEASDVLSCTECGFEATRIIHLENHINAEHLNEKRFACTSCDFQSFFSQSVKSHIISKHKGSTAAQRKTLECSDCLLDIKHSKCSPLWKKEKKYHKRKKKIKEEKGLSRKKAKTCQQCSYVTLKRAYLRSHEELSHGQDSDPTKIISCKTCEFQTAIYTTMVDHVNSIHLKRRRFKCSGCALKSYSSKKIVTHINKEHPNSDGKAEKLTCGECIFNRGDHHCHESYTEGKIYDCNQCDYTTHRKPNLMRHMKIHTGEKPYKCNQCDYASFQKFSLVSHVKTHNENTYKCNICSFSCKWLHNLRDHGREHKKVSTDFALELNRKVSNCTQCGHKARDYQHLKRHVEAVHLNVKRFVCNSCDYKSYYEKNIEIHIKSHHKDLNSARSQKLDCSDCMSNIEHNKSDVTHSKVTKKALRVCKICKYETKNRTYLKNHRRLVHESNSVASKVLKCADCEFEAIKTRQLENHMNAEHLNKKRFSCNTCEFQSFFSQKVKSHITLKHQGSTLAQMKTLECSDCQQDIKHNKCSPLWKKQNMSQKFAKQKENRKPAEKKAKSCQQCSFATFKSAYLRMHIELSHNQDSDPTKIISCDTCEFQTSRSSKMKDHANSVHLKQIRFKCSDCDLKSFYSQKIRTHMITEHPDNACEVERLTCGDCISNREDHTCQEEDHEMKNFECNFCDLRLTSTQGEAVNHMKNEHPNQKLFHCNHCSFKCNWLYNLRSHKKLEHKIEKNKSDDLFATFSGIIGLFMKHTETQESEGR